MTDPIKLPPLPEARIVSYQTDSTMRSMELRTHSDEDMCDYARAAIEVAKPHIIAEFLDRTGQWITNKATHDKAISDAIEADRQARGDPVAWLCTPDFEGEMFVAITQGAADTLEKDGWSVRPLYEAPQPQQIPEGYKLVPIEPTPKMKTAGIGVEVYQESKPEIGSLTWAEAKEIYKAMLEAAPEPKEPK